MSPCLGGGFGHLGFNGAGPSGWHTPVVLPSNRPKHRHGFLQKSPIVQGLPQARTACVPLPSWFTDRALAERAAARVIANNIFLTMDFPFARTTRHCGSGGRAGGDLRAQIVMLKIKVEPIFLL